ncbi:MAG: hypothetical protein KZQ58_12300, partial [gamma proteobacterium symbiont of Bathyaustriella thionipta]|nr:hypothetical protein [gamma proteobacterium symbiont of Bathyaustriella thionipta]
MNTIRKFLYLFLITMLPALPQAAVQLNSNSSGVNQKMVENQMRKVENDTRMSEEQRKRLLSLYQDTTGYLESAKAHKQSADNYNKQRINAPAEIASLEKHLDKVESKDPLKSLKKYEHKSLDDTRVILLKVQANLTAIKTKASSLEQQIDAEATRPDSITTRLTDIQNELSDLASTTLPEEDKTLQQALNWRKLSHSAALNAEIGMLDSELTSQPARVKLLRLQLKRERRSIKWVGTRLTYLENLVAQKRQQASEETLSITEDQQARAQNKDKPPLIRKILEKNSQLALQLKEVSDHLQQVSSKDRHAEQQAEQIKSRSRIVEQKLRITGLSQALGYALQIEKRRLPSVRQYRKATRLRESLFAKAQLNRIQFRDEQMRLSDRQTFVDDLTRRLPAEESEALQPEINTLLDERNTLLEQLISTTDAYISAMNNLDLAERQVLQNAQDMQQLLDENLLWVRSSQ